MRNILLVILFSFCANFAFCEGYMFRLELKDKGNPPYTTDNPGAYLSKKSIERRNRQGISIDCTDLPIDPLYLEAIKATGASIKAMSKWVKTVTVYLPDYSVVSALSDLSFVNTLYCVWKGTLPQADLLQSGEEKYGKPEFHHSPHKKEANMYGEGYRQISMLNVDLLHDAGFRGQGMSIAIMDVGFRNYDQISAFNFEQIKELKDFTHKQENFPQTTNYHGTIVLSSMLSNESGKLIGSAPEADYYLFKTEVELEEFPVEEDYWIAALEYADSIGVDVVNTSLGYTTFDYPAMNHTHDQLDGHTILASRAASMAGNKGMLIFNSAGNEGNKSWGRICAPSDADNIITVGAVDVNGINAYFSSRGPTADGRIKPDLCAMGMSVALLDTDGTVYWSSGTSFASPILAGAGACLWQALPHKSSKEIIALMKSVGDRYTSPDNIYGYGIPDMGKAYIDNVTDVMKISKDKNLLFFDTKTNCLYLKNANYKKIDLQIFNSQGQLLTQYRGITMPINVGNLNHGVYIVRITQGEKQATQKLIKW